MRGSRKIGHRGGARIQENWSVGGGGESVWQKKLWQRCFFMCVYVCVCVCVCFFLVLSLFYGSEMVILKETYHFSRFQRGGRGGGIQLFPGGVQMLIPCRNPYNFPGGGGSGPPVPTPPLWIRTWSMQNTWFLGLEHNEDLPSSWSESSLRVLVYSYGSLIIICLDEQLWWS